MTDAELIKSRVDIAEVVADYVELRPAGANLKAQCPFHDEKTPSFMVHKGKQIFHCFGCQKGGDIFTFIQEIENIDFPEALRILAPKAGVTLKTYSPEQQSLKTKLQDIITIAVKYYEYVLWTDTGKRAQDYLMKKRGLSEDIIKKFHLGYAPAGWDNMSKFLLSKKLNSQLIAKSGLVIPKDRGDFYDRFRGRIMFPIPNHNGQPAGFTGRLLPEDENSEKAGGKYINTSESPIFNKGTLLYGLPEAKAEIKQKDFVIFVEGQMDVISSHQAGVTNVVATSGTGLTADQFRLLKRLTDKVVFALDQDTAGMLALKRAVALAWSQDLNTYVINMPADAKDPAELVNKDPKHWKKISDEHINFVEFYTNLILDKYDLAQPENKKQAAQKLLPVIKGMPDPIERSHYINIIGDRLGVESHYIQEALDKIKELSKTQEKTQTTTKQTEISSLEKHNEHVLALIIKFPGLRPEAVKLVSPESLSKSQYMEFYKELHSWYNNPTIKDSEGGNQNAIFSPSKEQSSIYSILELKAEQEFSGLTQNQAKTELKKVTSSRDKLLTSQEIQSLGQKLKQLEESHTNSPEINEISQKLATLTKKLNNL